MQRRCEPDGVCECYSCGERCKQYCCRRYQFCKHGCDGYIRFGEGDSSIGCCDIGSPGNGNGTDVSNSYSV